MSINLKEPERLTLVIIVTLTVTQFLFAGTVDGLSFTTLFKIVCFGGPICSCLHTCCIELANNLCLGKPETEKIVAIFSNTITGIPYAELIRSHNTRHMLNQGTTSDPDAPAEWELQYIHGAEMKLAYLLFFPLVYMHRLITCKPRNGRLLVLNIIWQLMVNTYIWNSLGVWPLCYLIASTYVGACPLHPCAAHLLLSHHICSPDINHRAVPKIYSYYGLANLFTLNAGYHRERHMYQDVPWSRLPLIR
jgi:fatty acid desaturase